MLCKKFFALVLLFVVVGCGWTPVYYRKDMPVQTAHIDILPVPDESGRLLVQHLKNLLNPQNADVSKDYTLQIVLTETLYTDQGILDDNTSTRATMRLNAHLTLKQGDKVLLDTTTSTTSSYNILMLPYPTVTAEDATRKRLLDMLADQIAMRVAVYFQKEQAGK